MYPETFGTNPLYPCSDDFKVILKDETTGLGVVTYRSFEPGDLIAEFNGELTADMTQHSLQVEPGLHLVDLYFVGYFLHSCAPNVFLDMQSKRVYSIEAIKPGDFLYMDYTQTEDQLFRQFPCSCGASACRGWIVGRKELPDLSNPLYLDKIQSRKAVA
jgi:hypothetical protein